MIGQNVYQLEASFSVPLNPVIIVRENIIDSKLRTDGGQDLYNLCIVFKQEMKIIYIIETLHISNASGRGNRILFKMM